MPTVLALARINASFGTALQPPAVETTKFVPVPPKRILDTRDGTGAPAAKLGVGAQIDLQIAGVAGVPAADVSAVVLNVTATEAAQPGFVSVYPSGTRRPTVSNLNLEAPGQTAANLVTVKVGANGKVSLFTSGGAHLIADITGYYTPAVTSTDGRLQTSTPERILDTREGLGAPKSKPGPGGQIDLQVTGRGPVPYRRRFGRGAQRHRRPGVSRRLRHRVAERDRSTGRLQPQPGHRRDARKPRRRPGRGRMGGFHCSPPAVPT